MKNVIKRNGVTVDFDSSKITNAIRKANAEVADEVLKKTVEDQDYTVTAIQ